jgi:hypothetical protein
MDGEQRVEELHRCLDHGLMEVEFQEFIELGKLLCRGLTG